ncbi:MAG: hypothetical protein DHS20C15_05380 [Planctomycetota bacterium]|nr:MAG: hypothetical protein DHS20C15_05380 [Planctomycetota bacterium]
MLHSRSALLLLLMAVSLRAHVDPVFLRHDRSLTQAEDLAAEFPAAVRVEGDGSGTLIGPRWVLTAAHVLDGMSPFASRVYVNGRAYAVQDAYPHPKGVMSVFDEPPEVDLALLYLAEAVEGVEPIALHREADGVGREVILVGHGDHALAGQEVYMPDGVARAATNVVDRVDADGRLLLKLDRDGTELEGVGAPGDSGGPLLLRDDEGVRLLGVSSGGFGPMGDYGMQDVYASVPVHLAWIETTQRAAEAGELEPLRWSRSDAPGDTTVGRVVAAFFTALSDDSGEALREFSAKRRSVDAREFLPDDSWADYMLQLGAAMQALRPQHYAERGDRAVFLCQLSGDERWVHFDARLDGDGKLFLLGLSDGEAPSEPAPDGD